MSSHHIVREKQEPALLVLGLHNFSFELLGQLLEWSPTVIATEETAEKLDADQIKVDWLLTDKHAHELQTNIKIIALKNRSFLCAAMETLLRDGYPAVNIITNDFNPSDYLPYTGEIDIVIYHENHRSYPIKSGFEKWQPAGSKISIPTISTDLTYQGLEKITAHEFETIADGFFSITFSGDHIFISEEV